MAASGAAGFGGAAVPVILALATCRFSAELEREPRPAVTRQP
jgi:hypothetical protein